MAAGGLSPLDQQPSQGKRQQPIGRIADALQKIEQAEEGCQRGELGAGRPSDAPADGASGCSAGDGFV